MATVPKEQSPPRRRPASKKSVKKRAPAKALLGRPAKASRRPKSARRATVGPKPMVVAPGLAEPVPDEAAIQGILTNLEAAERNAAVALLQSLEEHLGSPEAARVWLAASSPELGTSPLEAIRGGKARVVQALVEGRWGPNPAYA